MGSIAVTNVTFLIFSLLSSRTILETAMVHYSPAIVLDAPVSTPSRSYASQS